MPNSSRRFPASTWVATWGGVGFSPIAPGTVGSIASLILWVPFLRLSFFWLWSAVWLLLLGLGVWAVGAYQRQNQKHDASEIVIDEVLGQGIVLWVCPDRWPWIFLAFGLFRLFDILKPWPICWIDRSLKTPFGVILDDLVAGMIAAGIILLLV